MAVFSAKAILNNLTLIREQVFEQARATGLPPELEPKLDLVLEEILVNVIKYAYPDTDGNMEVECITDADSFCCIVRDWGPPFDPLVVAPPDTEAGIEERPIGGLGLMLVSTMTDDCSYVRSDETNELKFCFSF